MVAHACSPSYFGGWDRRIAWTREAEVAVSQDLPLHSSLATEWDFVSKTKTKKTLNPGVVADTCNPSTLGGRGGWIRRSRDRDHSGQHGETPSLLKNTKTISWAWWCAPVIPATREAEAGESLEPGRRRLQWAEISPLHCSLDNRAKLGLKTKNHQRNHYNAENLIKLEMEIRLLQENTFEYSVNMGQ